MRTRKGVVVLELLTSAKIKKEVKVEMIFLPERTKLLAEKIEGISGKDLVFCPTCLVVYTRKELGYLKSSNYPRCLNDGTDISLFV